MYMSALVDIKYTNSNLRFASGGTSSVFVAPERNAEGADVSESNRLCAWARDLLERAERLLVLHALLAAYWLLKKKAQESVSPKPLDINVFFGCGGRI